MIFFFIYIIYVTRVTVHDLSASTVRSNPACSGTGYVLFAASQCARPPLPATRMVSCESRR